MQGEPQKTTASNPQQSSLHLDKADEMRFQLGLVDNKQPKLCKDRRTPLQLCGRRLHSRLRAVHFSAVQSIVQYSQAVQSNTAGGPPFGGPSFATGSPAEGFPGLLQHCHLQHVSQVFS